MKLYYHSVRSVLAFVLALTVFFPTLAGFIIPIRANAATLSTKTTTSTSSQTISGEPAEIIHSFIIERVNGRTRCRDASPREVPRTIPPPGTKVVPAKQPSSNLTAGGVNNAVDGLTILFDELPQLANDPNEPTVRAAFQRAAGVWMARIKSPITIHITIDYGTLDPSGHAFDANVLGSTGSRSTLIDYPGARTNLIAGANPAAAENSIYSLLPNTTQIPTDTGNGVVVNVNRSVAFALGIPVSSPSDTNVATMGFNKNFPFDFNPDNGISFGQIDFVATAVHEIGHALGFTSNAGSDPSSRIPTVWDLFRFRPGMSAGAFTTAERVMALGGSQVYFTGESFTLASQPASELALSTGGPDGVDTGGGDGFQSSHWKDDTLNGGKFIGIMDPEIVDGHPEQATENDFMAIEMLGWNLSSSVLPPAPPPLPPAPANDNLANAQVIGGCSGSVNGSSVGATHESGEPQHFPAGGPGALGGGFRSVWYQWTAPSSGSVTVTTAGSRFDTVMAVYTGSAYPLSFVGQADDVSATDKTSSVTFNAVAGVTYRIAVDGYNNDGSGGDFGLLTLNWTEANCTAPPPQILLEQTGPAADQAAILDSTLQVRDPFPIVNTVNPFNSLADPNTRVVIFVANLSGAAVTVNLVDSSNNSFDIIPADVHEFTDLPFSQVTFRLPNGLAAGTCKVKVSSQGQVSNTATFRIL